MALTRLAMMCRALVFAAPFATTCAETNALLRGSVSTVFNASLSGLSSVDFCSDTPHWVNGYSECKNEWMGWNPEYCQDGGWTCAGYVARGWCKKAECLPQSATGVYACGKSLNYPEDNCCACGKPSCVPERGTCGKNNDVTIRCCHGLQCQPLAGGVQMQCVPPSGDYTEYYEKNAYYPYGSTDIDGDDAPTGLTVQQCQDRCTEDSQCGCVTYARETGQCWKRANCVPSGWTSDYNTGYNVYMKNIQPQPVTVCVPGGHICGGPGISNQACCDGFICGNNADGSKKYCNVQPQPPVTICMPGGHICGGPGIRNQACCDGFRCQKNSDDGKEYCVVER